MTLRTPRRRISPRTKQRYRAIKNFLRRTLGTSSRGDTLTNSTLGVSVSDLKNKIECIEQQLDRVSKHCQDIATLEETFRKESNNLATQKNLELEGEDQNPSKSNRSLKNFETNILYKNSSKVCQERNKNDVINKINRDAERNMSSCEPTFSNNVTEGQVKTKSKRCRKSNEIERNQYHERHNINCKSDKVAPVYSTSSFHSLDGPKNRKFIHPGCSSYRQKQHRMKEYIEDATPMDYKYGKYERSYKHRRNKREVESFDEDFIADIIERQYKPVKLFGKTHSDFSQFSAPVCRDQEFRIRQDVQEGSELCSCCYDDNRRKKHRYIRNNDLSDMRSICDTRLYSSKENRSHKKCRRNVDDYNNSAFYDLVPVKEKSSPKSRRKFADDNKMIYHFKEVPPSPRTQRPRLNLKVHNYAEYENSLIDVRARSGKKLASLENYKQTVNTYNSDASARLQHIHNRRNEGLEKINTQKSTQVREQTETMSSLQVDPINISNNDTINTQVTDSSVDKTDKALGEIKNILQSFLIEIKRESTHDEKSNVTDKIENKTMNYTQEGNKANIHTIPNSKPNINHNLGNCGMSPFLPTFPSPCCYPIIPVCPMNCLQSGYMLPNPSFTCMACAKNSKENTCHEKECRNNKTSEVKTSDETQELIKEIYKFVSQKSKTPSKVGEYSPKNEGSGYEMRNMHKNLLTNRSVGSTKAFKHDANVGTLNMKCHSKSCEAIGSRIPSEGYTTNASYSDTVLDKLSLVASQSSTESDVSTEVPKKKGKQSPFKKVLRSLRLLRRKRDVIEEETESESTVEVNLKSKPPFKQHITNYSLHGQEYFHPPPIPEQYCCPPHPHKHSYNHDHIDARNIPQHLMRNELHDNYRQFYDPMIPSHRHPKSYYPPPLCHNYDPQCNQLQSPQVPLCLKEIEVKSIATQSERKMSIFHKFAKKIQPPVRQDATQQYSPPPAQNKPTLWKSLQEKAKQQNPDPMTFSLKTQKQLAQGDMKLRSAMLKKLFYKRNPFSPRNLIVRTLLGKDKSSFGDPPKMYRPRMFL
ncbi:unnamed protein product [Euphydryas editha]|uniref:Uncharacterized protein n=1 Tax=Euphydryas editha TaxID=104508 RepID=A0AAU9TND4_EUPED|nr:unnamed protein product [Euphydryas editha]